MFTGIVTDVGRIRSLERRNDLKITIDTSYDVSSVDIGASIACGGVCLTVVDKGCSEGQNWFAADVSDETLRVTNLGDWCEGTLVNLERSLKVGDELGGHIVTGHVDCLGEITRFEPVAGSITMEITVARTHGSFIAGKGSIAVNGTSLTVNEVKDTDDITVFSINLIPHTQDVTSFRDAKVGDKVNLEYDVLARYVARLQDK